MKNKFNDIMQRMDKNITSRPIFLKDESSVRKILTKNSHILFNDIFEEELKELFLSQQKNFNNVVNKDTLYEGEAFKKFKALQKNKFAYIYFPWNHTIIKCVKKDDYYSLKTNRNQDLITRKEQQSLKKSHIAICGMSVGSNIAVLLAQAGIANELSIADFDTLDHANLNRILSGIHKVGVAKTTIVAEKLYESDPYLTLHTYDDGVTEGNIAKILTSKNKIKIIFDEVDNLRIKILIREYALKLKIPVVMVTDNGEGVVVHVERYDRGYKKFFGKKLQFWKNIFMTPPRNKSDMIKVIEDNIMPKELNDINMTHSLRRVIDGSLYTWPQLGSSAMLGASIGVSIAKNIILGKDIDPSYTFGIAIKPKMKNTVINTRKL